MFVPHDETFTVTSIHSIHMSTQSNHKLKATKDSRVTRERNRVVQKKKLTDASCESNIKTVVEKHLSSENVHSAGPWYEIAINDQCVLKKPTNKLKLFNKQFH